MELKSSSILKYGIVAGISSLAVCSAQGQNPQVNPNILIILADDLGFGDLSCQGAKDLKTPNIDRIFNEGIKFTNFYANSTVCSPSRAALLTGCYPDMVGVPGVIRTHENESWGYLTPEAVLLPRLLTKSNYKTAIIGKWHLGLEAPNLPNSKGFDEFYGFLGDMMDDYYTHLRHDINYMRINDQIVNPSGHATDIFTDWTLDYLNKSSKKKEPFFLYLAYNAPHDPLQPPAEWLTKVKKRDSGISEKRSKLIALIEHLDWNIGRILNQLEISGQLDNTLIIFTSDNGGLLSSEATNGPYRGGKQDLYEGGIRVPAGFMWKNKIKPGMVSKNVCLLMDLFPTICEITGVKTENKIDGISILPSLKGKEQITDNRQVFFMRREGGFKYGGLSYYSARYKDYKIVQNTPWEPMQFFNLREDPYEKQPLEKTKQMAYENLFNQLTRHIQLSGSIPWQKK